MSALSPVRKAITAAGFALAGTLGGTMLDGGLTVAELVFSAGAALIAGAATWRIPNTPAPTRKAPRKAVAR